MRKPAKLHNLQIWRRNHYHAGQSGPTDSLVRTVKWAAPYSLCRGLAKNYEYAHGEYYIIKPV